MAHLVSTMLPVHRRIVGVTHLTVRISNPADRRRGFAQKLIVDSGAVYTIVPQQLLRQIGIEPDRVMTFDLADGRRIKREVGGAYYEIRDARAPAPVIFGKRTDAPLLGVVTLEALGFTLDPLRHALRPMRLVLLPLQERGARVGRPGAP
jgi:predicted aspartyl protease